MEVVNLTIPSNGLVSSLTIQTYAAPNTAPNKVIPSPQYRSLNHIDLLTHKTVIMQILPSHEQIVILKRLMNTQTAFMNDTIKLLYTDKRNNRWIQYGPTGKTPLVKVIVSKHKKKYYKMDGDWYIQ